MKLDRIIEACEWVVAKKPTYNDRYLAHQKGGVTIEVKWVDWERKLFNPMFACMWKHYADTRNSLNLKFNELRNWYTEIGEYLNVPAGMVENFHLYHLQPNKSITESSRSETALKLRELYPRVTEIIPGYCIGSHLMLRFFGKDATEEQREMAEKWLKNNLDKARENPTLRHVVGVREDPCWKFDPRNESMMITLRHYGIV